MPFQPGFDRLEAETLIAMLAPMEGPTPPLVSPPIPAGWCLVYQSPQLGYFDNKWELWHDPAPGSGRFAVLIRGTVDKGGSILDDLLSVMIPASGTMMDRAYRFAVDPMAGVHLGFAMAALVILWDPVDGLLARLPGLCLVGSEVYIAGHSQGAAIAALIRSFLANLPTAQESGYAHKTYLVALPGPGNSHYASEFNAAFANGGMASCVANSQDWVPQTPLTLQSLGDLNTPNPISIWFSDRLILEPVHAAIGLLRDAVHFAQVVRHKPQIDHLSRKVHGVPLATATAMGLDTELPPILPTLDFVGCGSPFSLIGVPGTNPVDPHDFFWQHHVAMYYALLTGQPIPPAVAIVAPVVVAVAVAIPTPDGAPG